jgi:glyoxylase I family protein
MLRNMAPQRDSAEIEQELREREMSLLRADIRVHPERARELLAEEFCEFGSSGSVYSREETIELLTREDYGRCWMREFILTVPMRGVALVRYRAFQSPADGSPNRESLRSSVWVWRDERWLCVFHQGTPIHIE